MVFPNYKDGSTANLMSSILHACGGKSIYGPLKGLPPKELAQAKNIVLFVVDALGYDSLAKHPKSVLYKHVRRKMTSVFPSATTTAVTTFCTGFPAQQSGAVGWYTYIKEMSLISSLLPYTIRATGVSLKDIAPPTDVITSSPLTGKIRRKSYVLQNAEIAHSVYSKTMTPGAKRMGYKSLGSLFTKAARIVKQPGKKYIYMYDGTFDLLSHIHGKSHRKCKTYLKELDKEFSSFLQRIHGTNTIVLVTADHGQVEGRVSDSVALCKHPKLLDCLALPLSGDDRVAYCHVKPDKVRQFKSYVKTHLGKKCSLHKSSDLIKKGLFGLGRPTPVLADRVGDFTLIMKKHYAINDHPNGQKYFHKGNHGGLEPEEVYVPLVVVDCKNL